MAGFTLVPERERDQHIDRANSGTTSSLGDKQWQKWTIISNLGMAEAYIIPRESTKHACKSLE